MAAFPSHPLTWREFQSLAQGIEAYFENPDLILWRGQAKDWPLRSSWERYLFAQGVGEQERNRMNPVLRSIFTACDGPGYIRDNDKYCLGEFSESLRSDSRYGVSDAALNDEQSMMALGRHHGLMTPLLDWSRSPYVAAFFAYSDALLATTIPEQPSCFVHVVCKSHNHRSLHFPHLEFISPSQLKGIGSEAFTRLREQQGVFTLNKHSQFLSHDSEASMGCAVRFHKLELCMEDSRKALSDLALMGVTSQKMLNDLGGVARDANLAVAINNDPRLQKESQELPATYHPS